jgi:hypothetical protein
MRKDRELLGVEADHAALELAMASIQRDPTRAEQIASMLREQSWFDTAVFATSCCQSDALKLKSWDLPPCEIDESDDQRSPGARLLKRMLASGISRFHPDPLTALKETRS